MSAVIKKFNRHLKKVFLFCPKTVAMLELKEELLGVLMEKYDDLIGKGETPDVAYKICIASIDGYKETIKSLEQTKSKDLPAAQRDIIALGVFSYIMLVVLVYFTASFASDAWHLTWLTFVVGALFFAIYGLTKIGFWAGKKTRYFISRASIFLATILSATLIYLIVSFLLFDKWAYTWIIFVIAVLIGFVIDCLYRLENKVKSYRALDTITICTLASTVVFFIISFTTGRWEKAWLVYILGFFVCGMILFLTRIIESKKKFDKEVKKKTANSTITVYKEKDIPKQVQPVAELVALEKKKIEEIKKDPDFADKDDDGKFL